MNEPRPTSPLPYGPPISLTSAVRVATAAQAEAERHGWPMIIAVVDSAGHLVLLYRMDQAQLGSIAVAQRKAETAVHFRRSTLEFQERVARGGEDLRILAMSNVIPVEGGLPLVVDGVIVGGIGVSGMAADQDGQVARAGLAALQTSA